MPASGQPVTLRATSPHAPMVVRPAVHKRLHQLRQRLDRDPVQLHVLPHGDVSHAACVTLGKIGNRASLRDGQKSVGDADPHHEVRHGLAFAVLAADDADAVALRVNAPRAEVGAHPLRRNRRKARTRELLDLVEMLPGVLLALQSLDALCFRFFDFRSSLVSLWKNPCPKLVAQKQKSPHCLTLARGLRNLLFLAN